MEQSNSNYYLPVFLIFIEPYGKRCGKFITGSPNGARKTQADHPKLPVTIPETVATAQACFAAGAHGIHAHVRDGAGKHILDTGLYTELLSELARRVPDMHVQITTEAVGQYSPLEQRNLVFAVKPKMVSVAMAEMFTDDDLAAVSRFYYGAQEQEIEVQHIVYSPEEFLKLSKAIMLGTIPAKQKSVLFVLGRYTDNQQSSKDMLMSYLDVLKGLRLGESWQFMTCAFGQGETDCLVASAKAGGIAASGLKIIFCTAMAASHMTMARGLVCWLMR